MLAATSIAINTTAALVEVTGAKGGAVFDNYALQSLPFVDEPRVLLKGGHFVGRTFDPHLRATRLVVLLAATAGGSALALRGSSLSKAGYPERRRTSSA